MVGFCFMLLQLITVKRGLSTYNDQYSGMNKFL